ncbi:hypothetical protein NLI96_g6146 [Meripilus lineatus]|uniref:Uncharacterized protein n=1 Tax=Meripilus lineatus TaxID=2056292 RepID=A0AAD5V6U2_9APHY|nr:hypothetical protein NLI96_g6146 [Physisporinus lineatus]
MSLLTPSESLAFNGFLSAVSSVDYGDVYEWGTLTTSLSDHLPPARGREALSRATKDLMALEAIHDNNDDSKSTNARPSTSSHQQTVWPTFGLGPAPPSRDSSSASTATTTDRSPQQQQNYTYGFALPRAHSNSVSRPVNPYNTDASSIPSH